MSNPNIDVLNDVTKTLIDSCQGYRKVSDLSDSSYALRSQFTALAAERQDLISAFQQRVRDYGAEPVTSGGVGGSLHRAWTDFTALFQKDEKASLEAVDDGEEYLGDQVESKLDAAGLDSGTIDLLRRALVSARRGESFADMLTDH